MTTRGTFKPGDVVRLKSNPDQVMTVAEVIVDFPNEPPWYECHWRAGGKSQKGVLLNTTLNATDSDHESRPVQNLLQTWAARRAGSTSLTCSADARRKGLKPRRVRSDDETTAETR